uniref:Uncharacterized protein n=1 Tax=Periophthalmus magnuspinnatus TaxID=409849 RepID=A0A3B4APK4_9GOBI
MKQQKVPPSLQTFNSVLKSLRRCGYLAKSHSLNTLSEMKALGIGQCNKINRDQPMFFFSWPILFIIQKEMMCLENKDLELGYKVHSLVEFGENWRLLGDPYQQSIYYGRFFNLLCLMEHVDVILKWYRRLIPSVSNFTKMTPNASSNIHSVASSKCVLFLSDIRSLGHDNKLDLLEELLSLMARDKHSPEVSCGIF